MKHEPDHDGKHGVWAELFQQISDPLDWAAAFLGGAGGAALSTLLHGADLGHSIPTGALTGVGVKKTIFASLNRPRLRQRAERTKNFIDQFGTPQTKFLVGELRMLRIQWKQKIISNEKFERTIDDILKKFDQVMRAMHPGPPLSPQLAASADPED